MSSQEAQGRWQWFFSRLSCMSPAEVLHRAGHALRNRAEQALGKSVVQAEPTESLQGGVQWIGRPSDALDASPYLAEALLLEQGSVRLFATSRYDVGTPPRWNRCPLTGTEAPPLPSHAISLTDRALVGDIKYVWELNRHLHLVAIAQAWALSADERHLQALRLQISSWLDQCPCGTGPNWTSSLELALRLLNWSVVWELIGRAESPMFADAGGQALRDRWLASINQHVRTIARNYSRHSSANNHLIGELAGVFVATCTWPHWRSFEKLAQQARIELEHEVQAQVCADGVLREQAFEYATFTFDFFLAVERCAQAAGKPVSAAYRARMSAMCGFIAAMQTRTGEVPLVGDSDGAEAFRLDPRPGRDAFASMLDKGRWLFGDSALPGTSALRDDVKWLCGGGRAPTSTAPEAQLDFPEGGYFLFGSDWGEATEIKGFVDAGPLGYLGIAAHGHADALQVWLSVGGHPLLIDPGTYSYRADKKWRDYFRGTSAHNTLRINGLDQSVSGGRFMWTRKARVHDRSVSRSPGGDFQLQAWHDGYERLAGRYRHLRNVRYSAAERELVVKDIVAGRASALAELHWHLAPGWTVEKSSNSVRLTKGSHEVEMLFQANLDVEIELVHANESDPLGWYSVEYGEKSPSTTLRLKASGLALEMVTTVRVRPSLLGQ